MSIVFAIAQTLSVLDANQQAAAASLAEISKRRAPQIFEPKDVLIETPRQGKAKGP
jgi:hypothetical protein